MKHFLLILGYVLSAQWLSAQEVFKFGNVPQDLLEMRIYEKDITAPAVVVYENCKVNYVMNEEFSIVKDYTVRIKILTAEGLNYATESLFFYKGSNKHTSVEKIKGLAGWTHNWENGQVIKEKLSKKQIIIKDTANYLRQIKFTFPSAKVGSVIEYKYRLKSPFYFDTQEYFFQRFIPVEYSRLEMKTPKDLPFQLATKGYEAIKTTNPSKNKLIAETSDLPALKEENFVWNYKDCTAGISTFIITGQTWKDVAYSLLRDNRFERRFNKKNLFTEELSAIDTLQLTDEEKLRTILNLVRSKVKWNKQNALFVNNIDKALKDSVGSSAEINGILLNALRNAGFKNAHPVVMSLRSNGSLAIAHPCIENLNYFVVAVINEDKIYCMDATRPYCDLNILPVDCLVENALFLYGINSSLWVDFQIGHNAIRTNIIATFNADGILEGEKTSRYSGECIFTFKEKQEETKETESTNFTYTDVTKAGDLLSVRPLLFETPENNVFKSKERKFPVEFDYPVDEQTNVTIAIPEGYKVENAPKSETLVCDSLMTYGYLVDVNETHVQISSRFRLNTSIIPPTQYELLRDFWSKMYAKNQELLVFKKL